MHRHSLRYQSGTSLLELLVACAVLAGGVIATVRLHGDLRQHAEASRQRNEAVRLAQQDLERLRAFSTIAPAPGQHSWAEVANATEVVDAEHGLATTTRYTVTRSVAEAAVPNARQATVTVAWTDRAGTPRTLVLDSMLTGISPLTSGALALDAGRGAAQRPLGRSPRIPVAAKNLGDSRSVWKPAVAGGTAFVFDNTSGAVVARCSTLAAGLRTRDLGTGDLTGCAEPPGLLLAGELRVSSTTPPSPGDSTEATPPFAMTVAVDGTPTVAPVCVTEARKTVRYSVAGSLRVEAVPVDALPAFAGVASWTDTGERHAVYACVVTPVEGQSAWSGHSTVSVPGRRACRYASDVDGSGAVDLPIEHGSAYDAVSTSLVHQNFLIVKSTDACPSAPAVTIEGTAGDVFADLGTEP